MPVAHGDEAAGIDAVRTEFGLESQRLALSEVAYRRAAADSSVMMLYCSSARSRNELGESLAADSSKREVDNVGIAEKVIKKRLDRSQRIRPAQLKQNYHHTTRCLQHPL